MKTLPILAVTVSILGIMCIGLPAVAQRPAPESPATVLTLAIYPNPPAVGDNTLEITASTTAGLPAGGLKLTAEVAMTTMDMGATHPPVKEIGAGRYRVKVGFTMQGPWRVTLKGIGVDQSIVFDAGGKSRWVMPKPAAAMDKQPTSTAPQAPISERQPVVSGYQSPPAMPGMPMMSNQAELRTFVEPIVNVPQLAPSKTVTVTGAQDWSAYTGFGRNSAMVGMMNEMMVSGSGMEGMKMAPMKMKFGKENFEGDGSR